MADDTTGENAGDTTPDDSGTPPENTGSGRFAVYDTAQLRFRGGVHANKRDAGTFKRSLVDRGANADTLTVREV